MKQHITIKQWDELTHDQKNKLDNYGCRNNWRMNIGQMIEFLDEESDIVGLTIRIDDPCEVGSVIWRDFEVETSEKELCDALWEAVKKVLIEVKS